MNADTKDADVDDTPEYPLPSPTDSLSRDQLPPDDEEAGVEQMPEGNEKRTSTDAGSNSDDPDIWDDEAASDTA